VWPAGLAFEVYWLVGPGAASGARPPDLVRLADPGGQAAWLAAGATEPLGAQTLATLRARVAAAAALAETPPMPSPAPRGIAVVRAYVVLDSVTLEPLFVSPAVPLAVDGREL